MWRCFSWAAIYHTSQAFGVNRPALVGLRASACARACRRGCPWKCPSRLPRGRRRAGNKARRWPSSGCGPAARASGDRAWWRGMRAGGPRSTRPPTPCLIHSRPRAVISTVNWAEVVGKAHDAHVDTAGLLQDLGTLGLSLLPFSAQQAELAGRLVEHTRPLGLSLGDRACIALAIDRRKKIYTVDRIWSTLDLLRAPNVYTWVAFLTPVGECGASDRLRSASIRVAPATRLALDVAIETVR